MNSSQPDLLPPPALPDDRDVRDLEALLALGTLTARQIEALRPDWVSADHRKVRAIAARSVAIVSAPGVSGYALADAVSIEDLQEIANKVKSQIRAMGRTLIRILRLLALRRAAAALTQPTQPNP
jgi:hypothetical protein